MLIKSLLACLQLLVAKSPLCAREGFVVHIEDKGLTLDWTATGKTIIYVPTIVFYCPTIT